MKSLLSRSVVVSHVTLDTTPTSAWSRPPADNPRSIPVGTEHAPPSLDGHEFALEVQDCVFVTAPRASEVIVDAIGRIAAREHEKRPGRLGNTSTVRALQIHMDESWTRAIT